MKAYSSFGELVLWAISDEATWEWYMEIFSRAAWTPSNFKLQEENLFILLKQTNKRTNKNYKLSAWLLIFEDESGVCRFFYPMLLHDPCVLSSEKQDNWRVFISPTFSWTKSLVWSKLWQQPGVTVWHPGWVLMVVTASKSEIMALHLYEQQFVLSWITGKLRKSWRKRKNKIKQIRFAIPHYPTVIDKVKDSSIHKFLALT